ncbi:16.9 kDa class I heat shock protein 3-like [Silene latifolia]|uniref:16.9 kDa class I heat shock protein 3-like n=1 Tax=Silene latifolia TaxID=37657 RepID=UPI003D77AFB1
MHWMGKSGWMVHVVVLVAMMMLRSVPSYGRYVEWSELCCEKGGSGVDMVKADVYQTERMYMIDVKVPGINVLNIEIKKEKGEVWVRSELINKPDDDTDEKILLLVDPDPVRKWSVESGNGQFWRRFRFPVGALMDRVEFRLQDGVLHVQAPLLR